MKTLTTVLFIFFMLPAALLAQDDETIISIDDDIEYGGFGALSVAVTPVKGHGGMLAGGYGAWIINHSFYIGFGGAGLGNNILAPEEAQTDPNFDRYMKFGYGGLVAGYTINSDKLLHFNIMTIIGGGGMKYVFLDSYNSGNSESETDSFFAAQLGAYLEINIIEYMRVMVGGSYRQTSGLSSVGLTDSDISGPAFELHLKFGKF